MLRFDMNLENIKDSAIANGWTVADIQPDPYYVRFVQGEKILDVWHTGTMRFIPSPHARAEHYRDNSEEQIEAFFGSL